MTQVARLSTKPQISPFREALNLCGAHLRYALIFSALVNLAYLAPTLYMLGVYDMVVPSSSEITLVFFTIALGATLFVLTLLDKIRGRILTAASIRLDNVFSTRLFRRAMQSASGRSPIRINQLIREADTIRSTVTGPGALAFMDAPWIPIYVIFCFFLHPAIGGLALGGCVLLFVLALLNERITRSVSRTALDASSASFAAQEAASSHADVVRSLGMISAFVHRFEAGRTLATLPQLEAARATGFVSGLIRFMRLLLQSMALGLGAWLVIHKQISGGSIFAASMLVGRALSPVDQIVAQWRGISQAITAYGALKADLANQETVPKTLLPNPAAIIAVEKVGVRAPVGERMLLKDVSFTAKGGQIVAVLGASGAGKTTLLQVLANARLSDEGAVRIEGARYADWDPDRLGPYLGYLPQDSALFPGTITDNVSRFEIGSGVSLAERDERVIAAARQAGVHDLILTLPDGYDTALGVRGRGLSAGQQQRVALARALYGDPKILIFDEPNANLDVQGEAALIVVMKQLRASGKLVIVAAHKPDIVAVADMLVVLREGLLDRFGPVQDVVAAMRAANGTGRSPIAPGLLKV